MNTTVNNMKRSAAILAFFLSASAWMVHDITKEQPAQPANPAMQSDSHDNVVVLRPLTD